MREGEGGREVEMSPFMTVLKGDEVIDTICLEGQNLLVMGRHHTCDLVVGHASSSRQHVEVQLIHATREIILTDLCSVHGTRIDGKRLSSMTPTLSKNTVTFQLGASTRVYRIEWLPLPVFEQSSDSASEVSSSVDSALEFSSSLSGSRSALSALRYASDVQDFVPSAPYTPGFDHMFLPQDENLSPVLRSPRVKRSPAMSGDVRKSQEVRRSLEVRRSQEVRRSLEVRKSQEIRKSLSSPKIFFHQDENISPAVKPGQLTRSVSSPNRPLRRVFSTLQPTATNARSPKSKSPSVKKVLAERSSSSGSLQVALSPKIPPTNVTVTADVKDASSTPSKLWLRRCSSAPLPALATAPPAPKLSALDEEPEAKCLSPVRSGVGSANGSSPGVSADAEYPPDKENMNPWTFPAAGKASSKSSDQVCDSQGGASSRRSSLVESIVREPFRPLQFTTTLDVRPVFHQLQSGSNASSEDDCGAKALGLPRPKQRMSNSLQSLDHMLRRLKLNNSIEGRRQWHVVIDTNCLLDADSLKALKQLEGIRETCVIIPKIVVRELDALKRREGLRASARSALKWIESCMVKIPTWIHVQSSSETLPVRATPPVSPSTSAFPHYGDLMSPTNDDHILECALIFAMTIRHGRVALLTNDTALKIKAMAEGLISESALEFCESLLSPYSNRFLWAGSTAHGKTWVDRSADSSPASSYPGELRSKSYVKHPLEDLHHHVDAQPRGLKLVVQ